MKKMIMKIKESLTHNVGVKIVAVIIATLIWLTVINITDPEKTVVIYGVPVTVTHEEAISDLDMVYEVKNDKYVNITISGKRSVVGNLSADDFKAIASLKELSKVNSVPIEVSAKQGSIARKVTIEKQSMQTLMVNVEQMEKQNFDVHVEYSGSAASGYVANGYTLSKNTISIKAPTSILKNISKVVAECELEGNSTTFTKKCPLVMYDNDGNVIKTDHVTMSSKKVQVTVDIAQEKEVPVELGKIGNPPEGYEVKSTLLSTNKVKLVGSSDVLATIDKITLSDDIDISKETENYSKTIDLTKYIPEGVTISGGSNVTVEIEISKLATKKITIKSSNIKIINEDNTNAKVLDSVKFTVQGDSDAISKLKTSDITATINVEKLATGKHNVVVQLTLPDKVIVTEEVKVPVAIKEKDVTATGKE